MSLVDWGWSGDRRVVAESMGYAGLLPCRVIGGGRGLYELTDGISTRMAPVSGAFGYRAALPSDYPVAGDFVACREEGDSWVIEAVLSREGVLSRKAPGEKEEEQVLGANVDAAFLVFALDGGRGFLPRLVERFMTLTLNGGVTPIVLLNKADLVEDPRPFVEAARASAPGAEVLLVSAATGRNMDELRLRLEPGRTYFFLGKSGVGKSSLINALFCREVARTGGIREGDARGRHTTTSRELLLMPGGALLLDAPGLREAALWAEEGSVDESFPEIASLADGCRFRDCGHSGEPGCAVQAALADGLLDYRRYESYLEYRREARYHLLRNSESAQRVERIRWKGISKLQKELREKRENT
jgi:ribosome biogenesis GTPase / thiamine phosphate phosphatase